VKRARKTTDSIEQLFTPYLSRYNICIQWFRLRWTVYIYAKPGVKRPRTAVGKHVYLLVAVKKALDQLAAGKKV